MATTTALLFSPSQFLSQHTHGLFILILFHNLLLSDSGILLVGCNSVIYYWHHTTQWYGREGSESALSTSHSWLLFLFSLAVVDSQRKHRNGKSARNGSVNTACILYKVDPFFLHAATREAKLINVLLLLSLTSRHHTLNAHPIHTHKILHKIVQLALCMYVESTTPLGGWTDGRTDALYSWSGWFMYYWFRNGGFFPCAPTTATYLWTQTILATCRTIRHVYCTYVSWNLIYPLEYQLFRTTTTEWFNLVSIYLLTAAAGYTTYAHCHHRPMVILSHPLLSSIIIRVDCPKNALGVDGFAQHASNKHWIWNHSEALFIIFRLGFRYIPAWL